MWWRKGRCMEQSDGPAGRRAPVRRLIVDASHALSRLDAECLEELAASYRILGRGLEGFRDETSLVREVEVAVAELNLFGRLLDVTRENLLVMRRATLVSDGCASYGSGMASNK